MILKTNSIVLKFLYPALWGSLAAAVLLMVIPGLRSHSLFFDDVEAHDKPFSYKAAVRRAAPAVVNVYNRGVVSRDKKEIGIKKIGSGVVMDPKGYILTNKHILDNAHQIIVALQDGRIFEAMLVGTDKMTDLAVLKIAAPNDLVAIPINPKRPTHVGDVVMAIGNPYNIGQTVTLGIVSATGRDHLSESGRQNFLQTDASINSGNSGGALINSHGELVGINSVAFDKTQRSGVSIPEGISFAIPTKLATKIMGKLIRDGRVIRGYIGMHVDQHPEMKEKTDREDKFPRLFVEKVVPDSPGALAGLQANDLIVSFDGAPAASKQGIIEQVAEIPPGSEINMEIIRDKSSITLPIVVQEYPERANSR